MYADTLHTALTSDTKAHVVTLSIDIDKIIDKNVKYYSITNSIIDLLELDVARTTAAMIEAVRDETWLNTNDR